MIFSDKRTVLFSVGACLLLFAMERAAYGQGGCLPMYTLSSHWLLSSLPGHTAGKASYFASQAGAQVEWLPGFNGPLRARVAFYKIVYTSGNDPAIKVEITHSNGTETRTVNANVGETGWETLGEYRFSGTCDDRVRLTKLTPNVNTRVAALRFDVLSESNNQVIASFILDEVNGNAIGQTLVSWNDLSGSALRTPIERLSYRGFVEGVSANEFGPQQPILQGDFALWLLRASGIWATREGGASRTPSTQSLRAEAAQAAHTIGLIDAVAPERELNRPDLTAMVKRAIETLLAARNLDWLPLRPAEAAGLNASEYLTRLGLLDEAFTQGEPVTRLHAAALLRRFADAVVYGGPPRDKLWRLTFQDEFNGTALNSNEWSVESGSPSHILSSRWPENVKVENGLLQLLTKKENRGGKEWTTGYIWSRFRQQYGYFEARLRIGAATGLNNAFWLMTPNRTTDPVHFEIDITESHFSRRHTFTLHNWSGTHTATGKLWTSPFDLSDDFHVYGLEWNAQELIFYHDGQEVGRQPCAFCRDSSPLRLSSAVGAWTGLVTDKLDGTKMEVDWVRVYEPAWRAPQRRPTTPGGEMPKRTP